jgi:hypothetical protein
MDNTVIIKSVDGSSYTFAVVDKGNGNLTDIVFPDGTILALAHRHNFRSIGGLRFWDTDIVFAAISTNLGDLMKNTNASQHVWDQFLAYTTEDSNQLEACFNTVLEVIEITRRNKG